MTSSEFGRVLTAYGGIFVTGSLLWGVVVDRFSPDRYVYLGAAINLLGVDDASSGTPRLRCEVSSIAENIAAASACIPGSTCW